MRSGTLSISDVQKICQVSDKTASLLYIFGQLPGERKKLRNTLCHYPMTTWNHARREALQLYGHVHKK